MARNVDLTGKLGLGGKPTITIGDTTLTVNDSATSVLRIMKMLDGDGIEGSDVLEAIDLMFDPKSRKALDKLDLNFDDLMTVLMAAVDLIVGDGEGDGGNAGTPATA